MLLRTTWSRVTGRGVGASALDEALHLVEQLDDDEAVALTDQLADLERQVSERRQALFTRIDALQAELTRRYKTGEASVESLLK